MFEGMIAKRYITSQKRHSAFTICSIAIALALITMLFSVFSTVLTCLRSYAYYQGAYHININDDGTGHYITKEQYDAIAEAIGDYGSCTSEEFHWGTSTGEVELRYRINVLFDKEVDSIELFMYNVVRQKTGIDGLRYSTNDLLIFCDMVDAQSRLYMVAIIALFYVFVLFLIMMLRLIIDTAFEISSKERERQFGVLQSVGATPQQIVRIITYEGLMLSVIGIPLGVVLGIGFGYLVYRAVLGTGLVDLYLSKSVAAELVHFSLNPWLLLMGVVTGLAWVLFSASGTGMRVIQMSPVQAISQRSNIVQKVRRFSLFGKIFGWTGKMASRNNMRQSKRFIVTVVSLTLSISLFSTVTSVISNLQSAAEDYYGEYQEPFDFSVPPSYLGDNPILYTRELDPIEESGLFSDVYYECSVQGYYKIPEEADVNGVETAMAFVSYFNRSNYNDLFKELTGGEPPVSYDELAKSGGYIAGGRLASYFGSEKKASLYFKEPRIISISEEEYNALPPEEQEKYDQSYYSYDPPGDYQNGTKIMWYSYSPTFTVDFDLYYTVDYDLQLIATLDQYENGAYKLFTETSVNNAGIYCVLADVDDYYKAVDFFTKNDIYFIDFTAEKRQLHALLSSVNIIATLFSVLIGLIAVVNMVNIISTGILNRRGELAAMQCVGMTEKQLYKMTVVECLQYALISSAASFAVYELLVFLTGSMMNIFDENIRGLWRSEAYFPPVPVILLASLSAFAIAIATSIISLRKMRRASLVEQIRSVE